MQTELEGLRAENERLKRLVINLGVSAETLHVALKVITKKHRIKPTALVQFLTTVEGKLRKKFQKHPELLNDAIQRLGTFIEDPGITLTTSD